MEKLWDDETSDSIDRMINCDFDQNSTNLCWYAPNETLINKFIAKNINQFWFG